MAHVLLCLNLPPELEQDVIDWLLGTDIEGFTSTPCFGHGGQHALSSVAERVSGKARRVQIEVTLADAGYAALIGALRGEFPGADILFRVVPVLCSGSMRDDI